MLGVASKLQYFRSHNCEFSSCDILILMEGNWEISSRPRKKYFPIVQIVVLKILKKMSKWQEKLLSGSGNCLAQLLLVPVSVFML